jgi:hypothetical protein
MLAENAQAMTWICGSGYAFGVGCVLAAAYKAAALRRAAEWPSVGGKIVESETWSDRNGEHFRIRYEFLAGQENPTSGVQGRGHSHCFREITGSSPRLSGSWFLNGRRMHEFVDRYPVGQEVEVFYDPRNPKRNCLDREDRGGIRTLWGCAAFALILTTLVGWRLLVGYQPDQN